MHFRNLLTKPPISKFSIVIFHVNTTLSYEIMKIVAGAIAVIRVDTLCHYFAECSLVCDFWKYLKTWFLRAFEFCINFTALDILLGIPNYGKNKDIDILNFVILFAKSYIYDCKKKEMPIELYNFQVKLKTHMVIQEYRCKVYNKTEEFESKWAFLPDSL